ncbi:hypothetical protein LTR28_004237 [Elasticomyces elasticus]|nr:hypothetical protein LTR28_004237 [Elasticomyces elasticus]
MPNRDGHRSSEQHTSAYDSPPRNTAARQFAGPLSACATNHVRPVRVTNIFSRGERKRGTPGSELAVWTNAPTRTERPARFRNLRRGGRASVPDSSVPSLTRPRLVTRTAP